MRLLRQLDAFLPDAGIPHYWTVDPSDPASLLACHLAGDFGYADGAW